MTNNNSNPIGDMFALFTFPGVIFHEFSHKLILDFLNVPVFGVKYYVPFTSTAFVISKTERSRVKSLLICFAPFIFGTFTCAILTIPSMIQWQLAGNSASFPHIAVFYIGIAIGVNAFPSIEDYNIFTESYYNNKSKNIFSRLLWSALLIISSIVVFIGNSLSIYGLLAFAFLPSIVTIFYFKF